MLFYYSVFNTGRRCKLYPGVNVLGNNWPWKTERSGMEYMSGGLLGARRGSWEGA